MVGVCIGSINCSAGQLIGVLAIYTQISSPSPTPSLGLGGTSSQVDELFPPSPPTGPGAVPILELESLKMGKHTFPYSL